MKQDVILLVSCPDAPKTLDEKLRSALLRLFASARAFKEGGSVTVLLATTEAADPGFARAASQTLELMTADDEAVALDGSITNRSIQLFV